MNNGDMPANAAGKITIGPHIGEDPLGIYRKDANGLTKREHFAGLAMAGLLNRFREQTVSGDDMAKCAVEQADALLKELDK